MVLHDVSHRFQVSPPNRLFIVFLVFENNRAASKSANHRLSEKLRKSLTKNFGLIISLQNNVRIVVCTSRPIWAVGYAKPVWVLTLPDHTEIG